MDVACELAVTTYSTRKQPTADVSSFSVEIQLIIIGEVFNTQEDIISISHQNDGLVHQAQEPRGLHGSVAWFVSARPGLIQHVRCSAPMCLFTVPELIAFARAVESTHAKLACIRRVYLLFPASDPPQNVSSSYLAEAQHSFITILCPLLDLHTSSRKRSPADDDILYNCLQAACTLTIDVTHLVIDFLSGARDIFSHFSFARNTVHL